MGVLIFEVFRFPVLNLLSVRAVHINPKLDFKLLGEGFYKLTDFPLINCFSFIGTNHICFYHRTDTLFQIFLHPKNQEYRNSLFDLIF